MRSRVMVLRGGSFERCDDVKVGRKARMLYSSCAAHCKLFKQSAPQKAIYGGRNTPAHLRRMLLGSSDMLASHRAGKILIILVELVFDTLC